MKPVVTSVKTEVSPLGVLVGDPNAGRIIAVSTSAIFEDRSLLKIFWGTDDAVIDSGFQGHLYTRPNDILVVRVPNYDDLTVQMVSTAIGANCEIWNSLTGIRLASPKSQVVLASDHPSQRTSYLPANLTWHVGSLLDAGTTRYRDTEESFLAFILNNQVVDMLGLRHRVGDSIIEQAQSTSLLMDKNAAMQVLQDNHVNCAKSYSFNEDTNLYLALGSILSSGRYVFKPAGGAAGIGVFSDSGRGASLSRLHKHLGMLMRKNQLPRRFQIQEFISGTPYGVSACFDGVGRFEILEIHQQIINEAGKFIGGRWTPAIETEQMESAHTLYRQLSDIEQLSLFGLICLDIISGKVIEVNPRLTAAAPVAHILRRQEQIGRHLGGGFRLEQIDLNTNVRVPYESIGTGMLLDLIEIIWKERGVLVLPQGLNPFGHSRFIFINDDFDGSAQDMFIRRIEQ